MTDEHISNLRVAVSVLDGEVVLAPYLDGADDEEVRARIHASPYRLTADAARLLASALRDAADYVDAGEEVLQA